MAQAGIRNLKNSSALGTGISSPFSVFWLGSPSLARERLFAISLSFYSSGP
jgi:hypothetical protein